MSLTPKVQKLLTSSYGNGGITYKNQQIFRNAGYYKAIQYLRRNDLIKPICSVCRRGLKKDQISVCDKNDFAHHHANKRIRFYDLTLGGQFLAIVLKQLV